MTTIIAINICVIAFAIYEFVQLATTVVGI